MRHYTLKHAATFTRFNIYDLPRIGILNTDQALIKSVVSYLKDILFSQGKGDGKKILYHF
jgi:hypothetical protein